MNLNVSIASRKILGKNGASRIILKRMEFFIFRDLGAHLILYTERYNKNIIPEGVTVRKNLSFSLNKTKRRINYASRYEQVCKKYQIGLSIGNGDTFFQDVLFMHNIIELEHRVQNSESYKKSAIFKVHDEILKNKRFKILINNSMMMKNFFSEKYGLSEEKSFVVYPGYDPDIFNTKNLADIKIGFRGRYGIKTDFVIGFVTSGNLPKRGIDIFFEAVLMLPSELLKNAKILVVGHKKDILPFVKSEFLLKKIAVVEPFGRVEELYKSIDLMVHPARIEEFGMVVLEAMACGVPVITSKMVGASEIYAGELKEIVVDKPSPNLFANKMSKFLIERDSVSYYGRLSEECTKGYTWSNYMGRLVDIYKSNNLLPEGF